MTSQAPDRVQRRNCRWTELHWPNSSVCSYTVLRNAFKRLAAGIGAAERAALFRGTAARIYGLDQLTPGLGARHLSNA